MDKNKAIATLVQFAKVEISLSHEPHTIKGKSSKTSESELILLGLLMKELAGEQLSRNDLISISDQIYNGTTD